MRKEKVRYRSVSSRYRVGLILILVVALLAMGISQFFNVVEHNAYNRAMDNLLEINGLFVQLDEVNECLYDYNLFLRDRSQQGFWEKSSQARLMISEMMEQMQTDYSRVTLDLCCLAQTYLDESESFVRTLSTYAFLHPGSENVGTFEEAYQNTQRYFSYINSSFKDIYSLKLAAMEQLRQKMECLWLTCITAQLVLMGLAVCVYLLYHRKVVRQITLSLEKLTEFARKVARQPDVEESIELNTGDELELFANTFNEMLARIHRQMEQLEADALLREQLKEAELENLRISAALKTNELSLLQSRINPHFLFNTLNIIIQTAQVEGAEETVTLMEATSEYLRYNLTKLNKVVTLADEVENARNYAYIQECRFGNRYSFTFSIDDGCVDLPVPCMILQPLIENSIRHGLNNRLQDARIETRIRRRDTGTICIEISDNGTGISSEKQLELQASFESQEDGGHIGLRNVYKRLKLFYGSDVRFEFDSVPGDCVVRILLPGEK